MPHFAGQLLKNPAIWQFALLAYWLTLLVATHVPKDTPLMPGPNSDKLAHVGAFAILAWLFAMTWQASTGYLTGAHLRWGWFVITLFGAFDEVTQPLFGRQASIADWLADGAGAILGLMLFKASRDWWLRRVESDRERTEATTESQ